MTTRITLWRTLFGEHPQVLLENSDFTVTAFRYASGVEGLKVQNSRGHLVILPWMGQMIWDARFDGHDLTMRNMFRQPKPATPEMSPLYPGQTFPPSRNPQRKSWRPMAVLPSIPDCWPMAARRRKILTRCTVKWPVPRWTRPGLNWMATVCA